MTCRFGMISPGFWRDARALSPTARLVLAYVHTSEHRQLAGLYRLPLEYVSSDLDLSPAEVQAAVDELVTAGRLIYDLGPELVYVVDWRRHDPLQSVSGAAPAVLRVLDALRAAPASPAAKEAAGVLLAEGGRLLLTASANDNGRDKLERTLTDLRRELTPGTAPEPTPPPVHPPSTPRRPPVDPPSTGPERAGLDRAGSPDLEPIPSNSVRSPAPAGSPRAPAKAKRARKARAADQPALLPPEPASARQVDPDRLPKDNPDSHPGRLARLLAELILARDPKARVPDPARKRDGPGLYQWACEIDKINRLDGREWAEIDRIIRWCQADGFWRGNILSAGKLRKQFDTLLAQADRGKPAPRPATAAEPSVRELRAVTVGPEGGQA